MLKSRGMYHSNQLREFLITDNGIELVDVYTGPDGVLTGAARATKEAESEEAEMLRGVDESNAAESERNQDRQRMARIRGADKT